MGVLRRPSGATQENQKSVLNCNLGEIMKQGLPASLALVLLAACSGGESNAQPSAKPTTQAAQSGASDGAKYARCAGSTELEKCRALVDAVASETPEAKRARAEKLERERQENAQKVLQSPTTKPYAKQEFIQVEPAIGMSEYEVTRSSWGEPASKNRTVTKYATREQWVYGSGRYIYLQNGYVTAISSRQ